MANGCWTKRLNILCHRDVGNQNYIENLPYSCQKAITEQTEADPAELGRGRALLLMGETPGHPFAHPSERAKGNWEIPQLCPGARQSILIQHSPETLLAQSELTV